MIEALLDFYGESEGLTVVDDTIVSWPYADPQPTPAEIDVIVADYENNSGNQKKIKKNILKLKDDILLALYNSIANNDSTDLLAIKATIDDIIASG